MTIHGAFDISEWSLLFNGVFNGFSVSGGLLYNLTAYKLIWKGSLNFGFCRSEVFDDQTRHDFCPNFHIFENLALSRSRTRSHLGCYQSRLGKPRFWNDRDPESIVLKVLLYYTFRGRGGHRFVTFYMCIFTHNVRCIISIFFHISHTFWLFRQQIDGFFLSCRNFKMPILRKCSPKFGIKFSLFRRGYLHWTP